MRCGGSWMRSLSNETRDTDLGESQIGREAAMPIKIAVTKKEILEADIRFAPAKEVMIAAFEIAAFKHDGSEACDLYWDMLCDDMLEALDAWRVACGMKKISWEKESST
jgi:hypothetical protein